jgi:hypothetical protein
MVETKAGVPGSLRNPPKPLDGSAQPQLIRTWARQAGMTVPERGPLPAVVTTAYQLAVMTSQEKESVNGKVNGIAATGREH